MRSGTQALVAPPGLLGVRAICIRRVQTQKRGTRPTITLDGYGHLMPGAEAEAADLLEDRLERKCAYPEPAPWSTTACAKG